jgi:uncharacterized membrane protein YgcG
MHALDIAFWLFFAAIVAWIGWTFLELLIGAFRDRHTPGKVKRPMKARGTAAGLAADTAVGFDHGDTGSDADIAGSDSNGGESGGGGDFSGGGGESGGGGSSGGW